MRKKCILIVAAAVLGCIFIFSGSSCLFRAFLGIPCPGCGMTRAYLALFKLDFSSALYFHPLFWLVPVAAFVVILRKHGWIKDVYKSKCFWLGIFTLAMAVYAIRMFLYFPDIPPMDYNWNSVCGRLIKLFFK
ncbi:MAG: DUF2752 domain-containing protein [Clostridia bacterium]|nr:DUF2752 domain-containing protein [Clostridia bacterium]